MSTKSYVLVGTAVSRSPSPAMMNEAFRAMAVPAVYTAESIESDGLTNFFRSCGRRGLAGLNVTTPFKSEIIPLLDALDEGARRLGAVNTVKRSGDNYVGFNTDIEGIVGPLRSLAGRGRLRRGAVIGAGGAARAFVGAMQSLGCREVSAIVRNPPRARRAFEELGKKFPEMSLRVIGIEGNELGKLRDIEILFNAAPIGGDGARVPDEIFALLKGSPIVFDAVYDPVETELVTAARKRDCPTILGYEMLLSQGAAAFEIWTGASAPREVMREALLHKLRDGER